MPVNLPSESFNKFGSIVFNSSKRVFSYQNIKSGSSKKTSDLSNFQNCDWICIQSNDLNQALTWWLILENLDHKYLMINLRLV